MPQENTASGSRYPYTAHNMETALRPDAVQSHGFRPLAIVGIAAALAVLALGIGGCRWAASKARTAPKTRVPSKVPKALKLPGGVTYQTLAEFGGLSSDLVNHPPDSPTGGITLGPDGNLYGTLKDGGKNRGGALYRFDPKTNAVTILTEFGSDGGDADKVIFGSDGVLYGTINGQERQNKGCVYRYDIKTGAYKILVKFGSAGTSGGASGMYPVDGVTMGRDGKLYGVTAEGGSGMADNNYSHGGGTLYQVDAQTGACTTLVNFRTRDVIGSRPSGSVVQGSDGHLYGVTAFGGKGEYGTLFRYDLASRVYTTLFEFNTPIADGQRDALRLEGYTPSGLIFDDSNILYGVTSGGGPYGGGALYRFDVGTRTLTPLVQFNGKAAGGKQPDGRISWDKAGWLYGTTFEGGAGITELYSTAGTLFRYNVRANKFQTLVNFHTREIPAQGPTAGVAIAADGTLYGTVMMGGQWIGGVLYRVSLPPQ